MSDCVEYWIRHIPVPAVKQFWKHGEAYVKRMLDKTGGEYTAREMRDLCLSGMLSLYLVGSCNYVCGVILLRCVDHPTKRHCRVTVMSGKGMDAWLRQADEVIAEFARNNLCVAVEIIVPMSKVRLFQSIEYKPLISICYKDVA